MPTALNQILEQWRRLKPGQRIAVAGAAAATLAIIVALVVYGSQPEYGVLFSDLKPADAQGIIEKLKAANVPYELSGGGTTVSVPAERVAELRLQIAASGALSGGHVGFDIFDKNSFGATDFAQQVNYQRALEGEIAKTLEGMDEIETARVHVTRPRESLFADKTERAKASVMLRVRQGRELSRERTEAIINLIASAVEGLDPADVSVMDTRGRLLSSPGRTGGGDAAAFGSHLEARQKLESETSARIVSLLEPVTGVGHVRSDVSADLDFSQIEQTEEKYDPKSAVIRSQQTSQEIRNDGTNGIGGIAGARANDPTTQTPPAAPTASPAPTGAQRTAATTNYEIDKTLRHTVDGGGNLKRMTVSVVVDYKMVNGNLTPRTPEELQKIRELVAAAVGTDEARGDQIVVQTIPFDQPTVDTHPLSWLERYRDLVRTALKYGLLTLAALLLIVFVIRPVRRALRQTSAPVSPQLLTGGGTPALALTSGQMEGMDAAGAALTSQREHDQLPGQTTAPRTVAELEAEMEAEIAREIASPDLGTKRAIALKKQLIERGKGDPQAIAMTLRGWLQESKS